MTQDQQGDFTLETSPFERPGATLHSYEWCSEVAAATNAVVLFHGLGEHAARYERFARALVEAGYHVVSLDCRGHGLSIPQGGVKGWFADSDGWNKVVGDATAFVEQARTRFDGKLFLFAHSMGSYIAQSCLPAVSDKLDGVVLSGTADGGGALGAVGAVLARFESWRLKGEAPSAILHGMTFADWNKKFKPNRTDFDWLSRDAAEVDAYVNDPLCGFDVPAETWSALLNGMTAMDQAVSRSNIQNNLPVMLISGDKDPANRMGEGTKALARKYAAAGQEDVTVKLYENARHELLNEQNRDEVTADILEWLAMKSR